jgi:hypothetical protein
MMSSTSRNFAAILLLLLVAVEFGGGSLLTLLYGSGEYTVAAIAMTLGVSRASIYRHLTRPGS